VDLSGVAATVFGVVPAFGELCPARSVAALSTTFEPALLKGVKNFSFSGGIRGPWRSSWARRPNLARIHRDLELVSAP
jgi:hypothetical protein